MLSDNDLSQGFADDLVSVVLGPDLPSLISEMQSIVNAIDHWCKLNGLELCNEKTTLVLFTWKRKFIIDRPIIFDGLPLHGRPVSRSRLGSQVKLEKHLDHVTSKASKSLMAANRVVGKNWGYSTNTAKWIFEAVVVPTVTLHINSNFKVIFVDCMYPCCEVVNTT